MKRRPPDTEHGARPHVHLTRTKDVADEPSLIESDCAATMPIPGAQNGLKTPSTGTAERTSRNSLRPLEPSTTMMSLP